MKSVKNNKYNGAEFTNNEKREYDKTCQLIVSFFTSELE